VILVAPRRAERAARLVLALLAPASVLVSCGGEAAAVPEAAVVADTALLSADAVAIGQFELVAVAEQAWSDAWKVPARVSLDPGSTQPLGSIVEGRVLEVKVFPGDRVREGDIVAVIHSHEVMDARQKLSAAKAAAISADSAASVADAAAGRAERLLAARAVSQAEVERSRAARTAADAGRDAAHAELERARPRSWNISWEAERRPAPMNMPHSSGHPSTESSPAARRSRARWSSWGSRS
jgi:multidrug efflux pump subunit AcrA (membrane-fusion protein)